MDIRRQVLDAARKQIVFTRHALDQMNKPERLISPSDVKSVVFEGIIIENYPDDARGASCLLAGEVAGGRMVHVVCSPKSDYLAVITAYLPNPAEWDGTLKERRR